MKSTGPGHFPDQGLKFSSERSIWDYVKYSITKSNQTSWEYILFLDRFSQAFVHFSILHEALENGKVWSINSSWHCQCTPLFHLSPIFCGGKVVLAVIFWICLTQNVNSVLFLISGNRINRYSQSLLFISYFFRCLFSKFMALSLD